MMVPSNSEVRVIMEDMFGESPNNWGYHDLYSAVNTTQLKSLLHYAEYVEPLLLWLATFEE